MTTRITETEEERIDEGTLVRIWSNLMNHLCPRHRTQKRNGKPTDWRIEDLRAERYGGYDNAEYFRRHIVELTNQHPEIQVVGDVIRLTTPQGLDFCGRNIPGWQRDF